MDETDSPPIMEIPNVQQGAGINISWVNSDNIIIHTAKRSSIKYNDKYDPTIHIMSPEVILFSPQLRKLVNESNGVFLSIQNIISSSGDVKAKLLKHSKQYRSILRACIESLQDIRGKSLSDKKESLENFLTIFYQIECIWHLTEILYVDELPGEFVLPQLLEWIKFHFPSRELMALKILAKKTIDMDLEYKANYWEAVIGCALHGKLDLVQALLALHSKTNHPAFVTAENTLNTMPVYNGGSVNEFIMHWKDWHFNLCSLLNNKAFNIDTDLEMVMKLISGDQDALQQLSSYTDAWYELLAAKLFYTSPCCKQSQLSQHVNAILKRWQANKPSDNAIRALMESDLYQVIKEIQCMGDNGWFAAHLVDLLYICNKLKILDENQIDVTSQVHESLILEYGTTLMGHHSLWQCGTSYLIHCPTQGLARLEILLQSLRMGSEARINKIIDIARDNKMDHVVTSICKIQGIKCIKRGRLGNALAWALKVKDNGFITYIADQFLKQYAENGKLECRDLLENLRGCMSTNGRLAFLGKYCEFHQMYGIGEFKEAASLLIFLLVSNSTPKYFWSILLTDAIPLLEAKDVILSSNDCFELLRCVEAYGNDPKFKDEIQIFRFAVARNLARALSLEGCQVEH